MNINIELNGNKYCIIDDSFQFRAIRKTVTAANKDSETVLGYCSTLGKAVSKIIREESGTDESIVSIKEYAEKVDSLFRDLMSQFPDRPNPENKKKSNPEIIDKMKAGREAKKTQDTTDFEF